MNEKRCDMINRKAEGGGEKKYNIIKTINRISSGNLSTLSLRDMPSITYTLRKLNLILQESNDDYSQKLVQSVGFSPFSFFFLVGLSYRPFLTILSLGFRAGHFSVGEN